MITDSSFQDMCDEIAALERKTSRVKYYTHAKRGWGKEWELLLLEVFQIESSKIRRKYGYER